MLFVCLLIQVVDTKVLIVCMLIQVVDTEVLFVCVLIQVVNTKVLFVCMLIQAASFGKCFLTDFRPEAFVNMSQMLRVLNQVRHHTVGIPLTYTQYPLLLVL